MKRVFKYLLPEVDNIIYLPVGAKVLSAGCSPTDPEELEPGNDEPLCIWALVDDGDVTREPRRFLKVGTGWDVDDEHLLHHIATTRTKKKDLIWHIFEHYGPRINPPTERAFQ